MRPLADVMVQIAWSPSEPADAPHLHQEMLTATQRLAAAAFRTVPRTIATITVQPGGGGGVSSSGATQTRVVFDEEDGASCVRAVVTRIAGSAPARLVSLGSKNPELAPELFGEVPLTERSRALVASYALRSLHNEAMSCLREHGVPDEYIRACRELIALGEEVEPLVVEAPPSAPSEIDAPSGEAADAFLQQLDLVWELFGEVLDDAAASLTAMPAHNLRRSAREIVALALPPSLLAHLGLEPVTMGELIDDSMTSPCPKGSKPWKKIENRLHKRHRDARERLFLAVERREASDALASHEAEVVRRWLRSLLRRKPKEG